MKCHEEDSQGRKKHSGWKHVIHMILCCGLPVLVILSLPWIAKISPALSIGLGVIAPFICPLLMGGMIFSMFRGKENKKSCCSTDKGQTEQIQ